MVVCGDDALARRLAEEIREVYGQRVTLVVPSAGQRRDEPLSVRSRASSFFGRVTAAMGRAAGNGPGPGGTPDDPDEPDSGPGPLIEAAELTDDVLVAAGVEQAEALALVNDDDETNIRAALTARRLNPHLRLVIRLYNRKLGQHLAELLDQACALASPGIDTADASTTVLSDADTAAPALAATAIAATTKVVQVDGLLLRAAERAPTRSGQRADRGLCTLALLSPTDVDPRGRADGAGAETELLPDDAAVAAAGGRGTVVLEEVAYHGPEAAPQRVRGAPLGQLFSRRLRWTVAGLAVCGLALAVATWITQGGSPLHATYVTLLDLFAMGDPAEDEPRSRRILQLLTGFAGLLLLPVLLAAALEAFGTFRTASALRRPPRRISGHVVLLGLGKIGTRVLARLCELGIPVVCVEEDPEARGVDLARRLRVPVVLGDVTQEGVLEAAKIKRAHALLALTSVDTTNLEAALYARSVKADVKVSLRLYDDEFATVVYRTLRAAHPNSQTLSRSCTHLAAPAFASAMMGRQNLGSLPVERQVLLFVAVNVAGHPLLEGRTVEESFSPGRWRVIALDAADPAERRPDLAAPQADAEERPPGLVWDLHPGYMLRSEDRVVVAATRRGLAELLGRRVVVEADAAG
ncbi:NAD-binding protein [Streptomyces boluensis]|uniref:Potassium transporter TrkA n=1 Tax=Streptomyces boluensis TaxID=1775135 RepID=A0A964UVA9_9ACTN|nr:NAD(P)-binding protein [Streptomyces boluensis]NBE56051.1 potassium transporter TrkA [Streptomyces boluensis]